MHKFKWCYCLTKVFYASFGAGFSNKCLLLQDVCDILYVVCLCFVDSSVEFEKSSHSFKNCVSILKKKL